MRKSHSAYLRAFIFALVTSLFSLPMMASADQLYSTQQQSSLDGIWSKYESAGKGQSQEKRLALYREAMPMIIETLAPGTGKNSYAATIGNSPAIKQAQVELAYRLGLTSSRELNAWGDVPFYP